MEVMGDSMSTYASAPWGPLNKTEITIGVNGKLANGTWSIYYNGTNVCILNSAWKSYASPKLTVYYSY